jgi:hypothetical protein
MFRSYVDNFISNLSKEDIIKFSEKQSVSLNDDEVNLIYDMIKNHFEELAFNTDETIYKIKDKLESTTYLKLNELINFYRQKYPNYLDYL